MMSTMMMKMMMAVQMGVWRSKVLTAGNNSSFEVNKATCELNEPKESKK